MVMYLMYSIYTLQYIYVGELDLTYFSNGSTSQFYGILLSLEVIN